MPSPDFDTLSVELSGGIARNDLNRPDKANAIDLRMWQALCKAMHWLGRCKAASASRMHEHCIRGGMEHVATWSAAMLYSNGLQEAAAARRAQRTPVFKDRKPPSTA